MQGCPGRSPQRSAYMQAILSKVAVTLFQGTAGIRMSDCVGPTQGLPEEGPRRAAYVDAATAAALELFPESRHMAAAATEEPFAASTRSRLMVRCIRRHSSLRTCSR